jgi:CHAP domain
MNRNSALALVVASSLMCVSAVALAEYGGQCVRYVKNNKPGGFTWDKYYPLQGSNGAPVVKTCGSKEIKNKQCLLWSPAKDIWLKLYTKSRGQEARVGSALVMNAMPASAVGHVAIVTAVSSDGKTVKVIHSNWDAPEQVSGGTFVLDGKGNAKYITSKGVKWSKNYPVLGFIYQP